jgi:UDP:flavonoid glycosyltransferase YjiC (YdhE family)
MRFALATLGSRGDVEPYAALARELLRRGHEVRLAVAPNYLGFVESAGLTAVGHGRDQVQQNENLRRKYGDAPNPLSIAWEIMTDMAQLWPELGTALTSLADGADLLVADPSEQGLAANVAEFYDIPVATLHFYPTGPRSGDHEIVGAAEEAQRRALGLPEQPGPSARPLLEIQSYDALFFPGLAEEWAGRGVRKPFTGGMTLELPAPDDDEVLSWIADGTPPIYFGFGSSAKVASPGDAAAMIAGACAELGERALICGGASEFTETLDSDTKVVNAVNHATVFPACRAVVHHGGPGTTFAGVRAGVPTLALCVSVDQPMWAAAVTQLEIGLGRRFAETTPKSLVDDLRRILDPRYAARAREVAEQMTTPAHSVAATADLLEEAVRAGR